MGLDECGMGNSIHAGRSQRKRTTYHRLCCCAEEKSLKSRVDRKLIDDAVEFPESALLEYYAKGVAFQSPSFSGEVAVPWVTKSGGKGV